VLPCNSTHQIEHVKFGRRMTQQMGEISEAFAVFQASGFPAIAEGPVLALFAEHSQL
jgi:hypothetical protein